jgi:hypothetical protein
MVYLLDPATGTGMSVDHQFLAQSIAERYPNVRLAQVPASTRDAREEFPFALIDATTKETVKQLREAECNISFIYQWLYEHDTAARGVKAVYEKYLKDKQAIRDAKEYASKQEFHENVEIAHAIAKSPLHTFRHGDRKIG